MLPAFYFLLPTPCVLLFLFSQHSYASLDPEDSQLFIIGRVYEFTLGDKQGLLRVDQRKARNEPLAKETFNRIKIVFRISVLKPGGFQDRIQGLIVHVRLINVRLNGPLEILRGKFRLSLLDLASDTSAFISPPSKIGTTKRRPP